MANGFEQERTTVEPPTPPAPTGRPAWVWVAVGIGTLLVLAGGAWAFFAFTGDDEPSGPSEIQVEDALDAQCEEGDEECRIETRARLGSSSGSVGACDGLEGEAYDDCVWRIALETGEAEDCMPIQDQASRARCLDTAYIRMATDVGDASLCERIEREELRRRCLHATDPLTIENCETRDPDACEPLGIIAEAEEARNPDICDRIEDESYANECRERVVPDLDKDGVPAYVERQHGSSDTNPDTDGDGLGDFEEIRTYGSDPTDPDTDGDGFSDGEEVDNGFSPTGPGRL